ncbi:hypothetical protein EVG20_g6470 [Dentipellis fragilis]|uniref:BHLH domain-containing protein n=1 Tax=Dentipellis fragilis TaxID=205917 RepID=A0A4Y9YPT2_9AGAM|nr:hypothetical protein EVG20_g6470 [Dentipellis fragilis]
MGSLVLARSTLAVDILRHRITRELAFWSRLKCSLKVAKRQRPGSYKAVAGCMVWITTDNVQIAETETQEEPEPCADARRYAFALAARCSGTGGWTFAGPRYYSGMMLTGAPPGYLPQPGPSAFLVPYGQSAMAASSPATLSETTLFSASYNEAGPSHSNAYPAIHTRAQEKAVQSASLPKLKRQLSDETRKKRADKAQRKRNRDVDDRIKLNNALPEDIRCPTDPPGQVEVVRRAAEYIPGVRSQVQALQQRVEDLEHTVELQSTTRDVVSTMLGAQGSESANAASALLILRLEEEIDRLRAQLAEH